MWLDASNQQSGCDGTPPFQWEHPIHGEHLCFSHQGEKLRRFQHVLFVSRDDADVFYPSYGEA